MAKKKLRVGVIGTGAIAHDQHLPYWKELEAEGRVEVVGVCDILKDRVASIQEEFGVEQAYTSYKKMLADQKFDVIDVCTQNRVHCEATVAALKAGAHVLVEKPIAMNTRQAELMMNTAKKARKKLMVAQHMRFEAGAEKLKDVIERGQLGQIYSANAVYLRRRGIPFWGKFHLKKESLGGPLIDIGVHVLDLAVWLMGSPKPVAASGKVWRMFGDRKDLCNGEWAGEEHKKGFDVEDYATALIRFEGGLTLHLDVSWAANIPEDREGVNILGDQAGVSTDPLGVYGYDGRSLTSTKFDWLPEQEGHRAEVRHFTECLEQNKPVRVQPIESVRIQKVIDAIYASSKKNREVLIK
jgi:predicted dehydrogenase